MRAQLLAVLIAAALVGVCAPPVQAAPAQRAYGISGSNLVAFNPDEPGTVQTTPLTGVKAGETLVGIDIRPVDGMLYAVGVNATSDVATLYRLQPQNGFAAFVGATGSIALNKIDGTAVDLPDPATTDYAVDFNPSVDRLRLVAGSLNWRVNPSSGAAIDGAPAFPGTNPDANITINGAPGTIGEAAYTNNTPSSATTSLYGIDANTDKLLLSSNPNGGTYGNDKPLAISGLNTNVTRVGGFDIGPAVASAANNAPVAAGTGYAALTIGAPGLYRIDLATGALTSLGPVGPPLGLELKGLALQSIPDNADLLAVALGGSAVAPARGAVPDRTKPSLSGLKVTSARRRRIAIAFRASEPATATIRVLRERVGRRRGKKCIAGRKRGKRCTLRTATGTLTRRVTPGNRISVKLPGKVGSKRLPLGALRVEVTLRDTAGNRSRVFAASSRVRR